MPNRLFRLLSMGLVSCVLGSAGAEAVAPYPSRPVTLMVGYQAGGSVDLVARIVGPSLSRRLGQPVIIENAPGAGGTIAASKVLAAPADGCTLLVGSPSEVGINQFTNKNVRYDALRDFAPIGLVGNQPMVLVGGPAAATPSAAAFLKYVSARPGQATYASSGVGTPLHLAGELIKQRAKVSMVHVPYRGAASMTTDLLGGQLDFGIFVLSSALPYIKSGQLTAIGVTSAQRSAAAPGIPALGEEPRLKGVDISLWFGLLAPARTPAPVTERLRHELKAVLAEPDVRRKLEEAGLTLTPDADFPRLLAGEVEKFRSIVDFAHISE